MKKLLIGMLALLLFAPPAFGAYGRRAYLITIVDVLHEKNDEVTSVTVNIAGSTAATIYANSSGTTAATNPIVDSSTATDITTLTSGYFVFWYAGATCDIILSDGTYTKTNSSVTPQNTRLMYDSVLYSAMTEWDLGDTESIAMGDDDDWTMAAGATGNLITFTPIADHSAFNIGVSGTTLNSDLNVYVGTLLGLKIDEGVPSFTWDGGVANINVNQTFATNINTGTATGAVNIGNSASGAWLIDGTSTGLITADASIGIATADGSGDITIDATAGSVNLDGGEAATDAVNIDATATGGGIDLDTTDGPVAITGGGTSQGSVLITSTTNGANALYLRTNGGTSETLRIHADQGTGTSSIDIDSDVGGINAHADAGPVAITATGATVGDMTLTAGDDFAIVSTGSTSLTATGDLTLNATDAFRVQATGSITLVTASTSTAAVNIDITGAAGGFDLDTTNGPVALTAGGSANGDMTLTAGDDFAVAVTGSTSLVSATTNFTVTGSFRVIATGSSTLSSTSNAAGAITIQADGGTSETILVHADQGTAATSIYLLSDAGGITATASAGPIALNATGATAGDMTLTAGDDFTLTVTGSTSLGTISYKRLNWASAQGSTTVLAGDTGMVFSTISTTGVQQYALPTAAVGLIYTFVDTSGVGGDDVHITANSGDVINGGVAAKDYRSLTDGRPQSVTLYAPDTDNWIVIAEKGTWVNFNNP